MLRSQKQESNGKHAPMAFGEFEEIRKDLESLKANVTALGKHLKAEGKEKAGEARELLDQGIDTLLSKGNKSLEMLDEDDTGKALLDALDSATKGLEEPIADHPRSSVLLASLAGYLAGNKLH